MVTISFGPPARAADWLRETASPFPLLIDRDRGSYAAYGVRRSLHGSWNLKTLKAYRELMKQGQEWRGIQGDSLQLGGDFVIDREGVVRLAYRSRDPADRPPVGLLLAALGGA